MSDEIKMRWVTSAGKAYIRAGDMVSYLVQYASTEETDSRDRLHVLCDNILKAKKKVEAGDEDVE